MTLSRRALLVSLPALAGATIAAAQESTEPIAVRWRRPFPGLSELSVSGDGQRIAALSLEGDLAYFDLGGSLLWQRPNVDADAVTVSRTGELLLAWPRGSKRGSKLLFFNGAGRCFAAPELLASPTCVAISGDGKRAVAGVGEALSLFGVGAKGLVSRRIQAAGPVRKVLAGFGDTFFVHTDRPSRVALIKSRGTELWHRELPESGKCSVCVSSDGKQLAMAYETTDDKIEVVLATWKNEELWRATRDGRDGSVRMNADGGVVLLAYDQVAGNGQQNRFGRRLAYLGEGGVGGWTKGGALTTPLLVSLDGGGKWLVALDNERSRNGSRFRLYGMEGIGPRQWIYNAPAGVHLATASANGRTIAVYEADGTLSVLQVNAADAGG